MALTAAQGFTPVLALILAVPLPAQMATSAVTGIVLGPESLPLANVDVRARDLDTGLAYRASTSSTGEYWLRGLPPGSYEITATRIGLRSITIPNVELAVGRTATLHLSLSAAAVVLEPLVVQIETPLIETTRTDVSRVLNRRQIELLPEESRNFLELAALVPGATAGTTAVRGHPSFGTRGSAVGALNQQSLGVLVDGGDFTEALFGELGGSIPMLAIQEFEVVRSQYAAELGRAASGVVNVVTRRGGNDLRFEGFGLFRHHVLNARSAFEVAKPDFNQSHWGVGASRAIVRDRSHVLAVFERRVQNDFSTVNTGGAFPEAEGTFKTPLTDNLTFVRLDHRASEAHELSLRYSGEIAEQLFGVGGVNALENGLNHSLRMHSGLLTHRWVPAGTWLSEARLHVMRTARFLRRNAGPAPTLVYPSLRAGPNRRQGEFRTLRVELREDVSRLATGPWGTHRLKVGARLGWQENSTETVFFDNGFFVFPDNAATQPVLGIVTFENGAIGLDESNLALSLYVQDSWSPLPGLTLNLGIRYDLETNGSNQDFVSPFAGDLPFIPTTPRPADRNNLAPRIGVAWDPTGSGRTVVRGGFGIFYDALAAIPLLALERSTGQRTAQIPNPGTTDIDELVVDPQAVPPAVWTQGKIETPMTRQYSAGVEHMLLGGLIVRIDGLFVEGRNLLLQRHLNPVLPERGPTYPGFGSVLQVLSEGRAEAKMVLFEARKEFLGGWVNVGYTLADRKNTNDTWGGGLVPQTDPENLDLAKEWGPAAWDERHRLVGTGGISLPFELSAVAKVVYSSGRPFTAITGNNDNGDTDAFNDRPPGEARNSRRGPDYFRTDLGLTWTGEGPGSSRVAIEVNAYNLFNNVSGMPSSVQNVVGAPQFGQALAAFPGRQLEIGLQMEWE